MISIIVPTRNRAASLRRTLEGFAAMVVSDGMEWEIVVVDNGSSDQTSMVVAEFQRTSGLAVQYLVHPPPGVSGARNRGLEAARGAIVAFTDDDVLVDAHWLSEIVREFASDPDLGMLSGPTMMKTSDKLGLATSPSMNRVSFRHPCNPRKVGLGSNIAVRAWVVEEIGGFDTNLGAGTRDFGGEDGDFIYRAVKAGVKTVRNPAVVVYHEHDRTTVEAVRARQLHYVRGRGAMLCKHALQGDTAMIRRLVSETCRLLRAMFRAPRPDRPTAFRRLLALYSGVARRIALTIRP